MTSNVRFRTTIAASLLLWAATALGFSQALAAAPASTAPAVVELRV